PRRASDLPSVFARACPAGARRPAEVSGGPIPYKVEEVTALTASGGRTRTSSFGTSKRESHDASSFYARNLYVESGKAGVTGAGGASGHDGGGDAPATDNGLLHGLFDPRLA